MAVAFSDYIAWGIRETRGGATTSLAADLSGPRLQALMAVTTNMVTMRFVHWREQPFAPRIATPSREAFEEVWPD